MTNTVVELRRAANTIFAAADQPVSGEISRVLVQGATEIEALIRERHQLRNELTAARLEGERLRNIVTGCPVCSELERNIKPADEPLPSLVVPPSHPMAGQPGITINTLLPTQMEPDASPLTHQEIFSAVYHHAAEIVRLTAAVPAQCSEKSGGGQ